MLPLQRPHAAIIDLDGTLIDTLDELTLALQHTLGDLGLPTVARAFVARTIGKGSEHLLRSTLAEVGGRESDYPAAWQAYQAHYQRLNGSLAKPFPGVMQGLQALRQAGVRLACLTNKPLAFARPLLERQGLADLFEHIFGGDSFARHKPDPLPLLETCRALGSAPACTWMVGDSSNDAQAGHAAGCPVVLVSYGYNHGQPIQAVAAHAYVDSLAQLPGLWVA